MTTNIYYLIKASDVETAMNYAPINGSPNQLFQYRISDNGKAIVQAEWINTEWLEVNGTFLGELLSNGSASQGVYDELVKPEWGR